MACITVLENLSNSNYDQLTALSEILLFLGNKI